MKALLVAASLMLAVPTVSTAGMLSVISKYQGMHEVKNRASLKRMIGVDPRRVPWCGAMMTYVAKRAGRKPPVGSFKAAAWQRFGKTVKRSQARPGDIAVVRYGQHVMIFTGFKSGKACGWAGNTSNRVAHGCWGGLISVRR